jgi:predicted RNA polymerase sigma factor
VEFTDAEIETDPILRYFHYDHLPQDLQQYSQPFCQLARLLVDLLPRNPERTVALRKLLEAKDAAVRANV